MPSIGRLEVNRCGRAVSIDVISTRLLILQRNQGRQANTKVQASKSNDRELYS